MLLHGGATSALAQGGTIAGRVGARGTNEPISQARVSVLGTTLSVISDADGKYTLRNVPAGTQQIRAVRVGYVEQKLEAQVTAGQTATLDFQMTQAVVQLAEVVTTATGESRRVEQGNSIATLGDVSKRVEEGTITSIGDLLSGGKAAGVSVLTGNMTGSVPVVRIRGLGSLATNGSGISNAPIYVVDGVRVNTSSINIGTGGTNTSYLNLLTPEEIQDVEIVKGPSAATLYGTDAANGVIVITTKKGRAGSTRWTFFGEGGIVDDRNDYMTQYALWGHNSTGALTRCVLKTIADGACTVDSTTSYNLFETPGVTPIVAGNRHQYGSQVNGGSDAVRYFVSGDFEQENGPLKMPDFAINRFDSLGIAVRDEWKRPEALSKQNFRANLSATLSPKMELNVSTGFVKLNQRLPQTDNNSFSYIFQAYNNPGYVPDANHSGLGYSKTGALGETLNGFRQFSPGEIFQVLRDQTVQDFIGSANLNWHPFSWMQNEATTGVDLADRYNLSLCRFNECPFSSATSRLGSITDTHSNDRQFTAKINSTATWAARAWMSLATTLGSDYVNNETEQSQGSGTQLPPGAQTVGAAAVRSGANTLPTASKTWGLYAQEQASIRDRLFLTVAVRSDQNSAFGTNFQRVFYPKASASWIISDESWFPHFDFLNQFRLRSSFGASGVQPGATVSLLAYAPATVTLANTAGSSFTDTPGVRGNQLGNENLKPERSTEIEGGFESRLFDRIFIDFTYFNKKTRDAIISQPIAPSAAPFTTSVQKNLGSVRNSGVEVTVTSTILNTKPLGWDLTISGSHINNKVVSLGVGDDGKPTPTIGTGATRDSVGLPVNAWFYRPYRYSDVNNDGLIGVTEVWVGPNVEYRGYSFPRDQVSFANGVNLFDQKLRLNVLVDYKGGFGLLNQTWQFYCQQTDVCKTESTLNHDLGDQARLIVGRYKNPSTSGGYLENGQFWRLREVSGTFALPGNIAPKYLRARDASLTFAARNLHVWTSYTGTDPESNYATGDVQTDFSTTAPPTYFTLRLNLHY